MWTDQYGGDNTLVVPPHAGPRPHCIQMAVGSQQPTLPLSSCIVDTLYIHWQFFVELWGIPCRCVLSSLKVCVTCQQKHGQAVYAAAVSFFVSWLSSFPLRLSVLHPHSTFLHDPFAFLSKCLLQQLLVSWCSWLNAHIFLIQNVYRVIAKDCKVVEVCWTSLPCLFKFAVQVAISTHCFPHRQELSVSADPTLCHKDFCLSGWVFGVKGEITLLSFICVTISHLDLLAFVQTVFSSMTNRLTAHLFLQPYLSCGFAPAGGHFCSSFLDHGLSFCCSCTMLYTIIWLIPMLDASNYFHPNIFFRFDFYQHRSMLWELTVGLLHPTMQYLTI